MPDDPLKRLNILMLSGVLQPLSVAAALRLTEPHLTAICARAVEIDDEDMSLIRTLIDDYAIAFKDVNMSWRALGPIAKYPRRERASARRHGVTLTMPTAYDERIESLSPEEIAMLTPAERDELAALEAAAKRERFYNLR